MYATVPAEERFLHDQRLDDKAKHRGVLMDGKSSDRRENNRDRSTKEL